MRGKRATFIMSGTLIAASLATAGKVEPEFTQDFSLERCTFSNRGGNTFFNLDPGTFSVLEGEDDGELVLLRITALNATRPVVFRTAGGRLLRVETRVIEEREWTDGELVEVSRNYFARCRETGDVLYFGEDVDIYENGVVVSHAGAWLAGAQGALPGLIMPGTFLLGSRYFQEVAPGVALDRAEHAAMNLELDVPFGALESCVEIVETTPLEPRSQSIKIYCPGVGLTVDSGVELAEHVAGDDD